eukprot:10750231-Karenia_brevis.AAC.1
MQTPELVFVKEIVLKFLCKYIHGRMHLLMVYPGHASPIKVTVIGLEPQNLERHDLRSKVLHLKAICQANMKITVSTVGTAVETVIFTIGTVGADQRELEF